MIKQLKIVSCFLLLLLITSLTFTQTQIPIKKQVKVLKGPDPNAIYFQLRAGEPKIIQLSRRPGVREAGEVSIHMEDFSIKLSPGDPILPYHLYHVILPPDADPASLNLEVIRFAEEEIKGTFRIAPAPPCVPCRELPQEEKILEKEMEWGVGKKIVEGKNLFIYANDALHPAQNCKVTYGGQQRKWKIATISYYPIRYNPVKGKLLFAKEVDLKVNFRRDNTYLQRPEVKALMRDNVFDGRVRDKVLNFNHAKAWYVSSLLEKPEGMINPDDNDTSSQPPDPNYVIITTDETFANSTAMDDFCFHKENLGFEVMVVTEHQAQSVEGDSVTGYTFAPLPGIGGYEDVTGAPAPNERPDKIRKWLQDNYIDLEIEYVLIVGNPDPDNAAPDDLIGDLPMKDCQLNMDMDVPTDFYFAELTGDWDLDNDGYAGEYYTTAGDSEDIPDGITNKSLFSVRWEGVLDVDYAVANTTLAVEALAGSRYITVDDSTGFNSNQDIRIGLPGEPDTEYLTISSINGNQWDMNALSYYHPAGTPVETIGFVELVAETEGNTRVWFDENRDGLDDSDIILAGSPEHRIYNELVHQKYLPNGQYPIRIEYTQSGGDAFCYVKRGVGSSNVNATFKRDDGTGTYIYGLDADFFNNDTLSGTPIPETNDSPFITDAVHAKVLYAVAGDIGTGGVEFFAEVIVGRIPCYDENQDGSLDYDNIDNILNKTIAYENAIISENPWRRSILAISPYVTDNPYPPYESIAKYEWAERLRDNIASPPLWDWYRIYAEDFPGLSSPPEHVGCSYDVTLAGWNDPADPDDGRGVVMWMSHGQQASATSVFANNKCSDLDDTKPSIVFMGACNNGKPEYIPTHGIPLGYVNLKEGAIATISATRASYGCGWIPDDIYIPDFYNKDNHHLLYFFGKDVLQNISVGEVLTNIRKTDALTAELTDWKSIFDFNLYGDPSLSLFGADPAYKSDVVFLLDGSGSMVSPEPGKWQAAVDAAVLFYDLMKAFRYPTFEDRYNSVLFRASVYPSTTTVPPTTGMKDMSIPLEVSTFNPDFTPEPHYKTPMGQGLRVAASQFETGTEEDLYTDKMIILLSDGKHNEGRDPLNVIHASDWPGGIKVYSVGLGDDDIEPETIEYISGATYGDYRISPTPREIEGFFCEIFCDTSWKLQNVTVNDDRASIDHNKAVFIVVWDDPTASINFELDPPGTGPNITPTNLAAYPGMTVTYHASAAGETHAFYVCENIPAELLGEWQFINIDDGTGAVPLSDVLLKVLLDPRVIVDFEIDNIDHYTGQPIILRARITEDGKALTGLTEVYAELISSPALAVGTLTAENSPATSYPAQPSDKIDITPRKHYLLGVMKNLGVSNLSKSGGSRIVLHDDGLNSDLRADDGIYTGTFTVTQYEGSYTFKFRATGKNKDGITFDRGETLSEYVKFAANPEETSVIIVDSVTIPEENIIRATLKVTPRDSFSSYLGPFRGDMIKVWSDIGHINPGYADNKDGSYSFEFTYPIDTVPHISVAVGDVIVEDREEVKPTPKFPYSFSIHVGSTVPRDNFNSLYNSSYSFGLNFDYHFTNQISLIGLVGYNQFNSGSSLVNDTHWWNISGNLKYRLSQRTSSPYINGGFGYYIPDIGDSGFGVNLGAGIDYDYRNNLILEFGVDFHTIFDKDVQFFNTHAGLIFRF